jgi:hypothetical protein
MCGAAGKRKAEREKESYAEASASSIMGRRLSQEGCLGTRGEGGGGRRGEELV